MEEAEGFGGVLGGVGASVEGDGGIRVEADAVEGDALELLEQVGEGDEGDSGGGALGAAFLFGGRGRGGGMDGGGAGGVPSGRVFVLEGEGREFPAEMPLDIEGEHAEEDMGADAVVAEVADGSESEILFGLEGSEGGLDAAETFVGEHSAFGGEVLGGEAGADDIEAIEGGRSGDGVVVALEGEVGFLGVGEEVLAHLAPVEDAGGGDGDGFGFSEGSGLPLGALFEFFELRFGGVEKRFALSGTFGGDAGVVADDEALAGEEGAVDFGKPVPVEEGGLEVGVVDQGLDLVGTQRGDPVELRAGAEVLADAGGGDHAAVADPDEALSAEAPLDLLDLGGEGLGVGGVAGEDLDADGAAVLGGEESDDDLWPVGAMVAGVAVGGEFTAASLEVGGGDVVEEEA